ncbi:MAG: hypothetical protein ABSD71_15610 [Bacteroidales bacterium]
MARLNRDDQAYGKGFLKGFGCEKRKYYGHQIRKDGYGSRLCPDY